MPFFDINNLIVIDICNCIFTSKMTVIHSFAPQQTTKTKIVHKVFTSKT